MSRKPFAFVGRLCRRQSRMPVTVCQVPPVVPARSQPLPAVGGCRNPAVPFDAEVRGHRVRGQDDDADEHDTGR